LRLGTRGSALALVQAEAVEAALRAAHPGLPIERVIIRTTGDRRTDVALSQVAKAEGVFDKGVFIKELEQALADGVIDLAVHSLKDLPTVVDPRFSLAAVLERAPVADVLISRDGWRLAEVPAGAVVGTSSVRRARQVSHLRPDLRVEDLRGNVPTRLEKLRDRKGCDVILLAEAGLVRLGYLTGRAPGGTVVPLDRIEGLHGVALAEEDMFPAAGQGAVGIEIRADDEAVAAVVAGVNHAPTWARVSAEREFLRLLGAGCHTPVGVVSGLQDGILSLQARVFPEGTGPPRTGSAAGSDPLAVAGELHRNLI
jgi:hydroxymethylbilane synthase